MKLGLQASAHAKRHPPTRSDPRSEDELKRVEIEETMTLKISHIKQEMQSNT
jgi:hypothetical protein